MVKTKNNLHLTDFFYEHIENLKNEYHNLITDHQDRGILKEIDEEIISINYNLRMLEKQEKEKGIDLKERKKFVYGVEQDLYYIYKEIKCENYLKKLLKEF